MSEEQFLALAMDRRSNLVECFSWHEGRRKGKIQLGTLVGSGLPTLFRREPLGRNRSGWGKKMPRFLVNPLVGFVEIAVRLQSVGLKLAVRFFVY